MKERSCFFLGHQNADMSLMPRLIESVERQISEYHTIYFYVGHYGNFDRMAACAVANAKQHYPKIKLYLLLPYHPNDQKFSVPLDFDGTYYPPGMEFVPKRLAIVQANRHMIDNCSHLISYVWHHFGHSHTLMEYAQKRENKGLLHIHNLAD